MASRNENRIKSRVYAEKVAVALKSWNFASNADILNEKGKLDGEYGKMKRYFVVLILGLFFFHAACSSTDNGSHVAEVPSDRNHGETIFHTSTFHRAEYA